MAIQRTSVWLDDAKPTDYPKLEHDVSADVAIVGGGISGIVSAYLLAKAGKKVVLLDKGSLAHGETGYTTAFITYDIDEDLQTLISRFGQDTAREIWRSTQTMVDQIETIVSEEKIDCDFQRVTARVYARDEQGVKYLEELDNAIGELGFSSDLVSKLDGQLPFECLAYLEEPNHAKFQPLKFLTQLAQRAQGYGAEIFEETMVTGYPDEHTVETAGGHKVSADKIIVATHNPNNNSPEVLARNTAYITYVIAGKLPAGLVPEGLYWDTADPYHYLRIDAGKGKDRFIFGGEDHAQGKQADKDPFQNLRAELHSLLPGVDFTVTHEWSGQVLAPIDGIPFIGYKLGSDSQLIASGYNGDGMVFSNLAARINTDLILGKANSWAKIYTVKRIKNITEFIKKGFDMGKEKLFGMKGTSKINSAEELPAGSGAVIEMDGHKVAIYRSRKGDLQILSAVCTHQGCIVDWNRHSETWDCPCHGSRFAIDGSVITGPAKQSLAKKV